MKPIIPVLLGADLNCYHVARAFHEAYGVVSYAFGRYAVSATKYSKIVRFTAVPDLEDETVMLRILHEFAAAHKDAKLILMGCTDNYAAMIIRRKAELPEYVAPCPDESLYGTIQKKAEFYEVCDRFGIEYPKTVVLTAPADEDAYTEEALGFAYPIIVKPSSSVIYWEHPFDGMKKVYVASSPNEAAAIVREIYASGYDDRMILQKMIPGEDDHMRVLTCFSDEHGKVRAMCLGHTMVEEHTPKGLGNHAAIVVEPVSSVPVAEKLRLMLEDIGYTGFANFDLKYCDEDGDYKVFEINLRQGRSNYYITGSGLNIARLVAERYEDGGTSLEKCEDEHFWHYVPKKVAYSYTADEALVKKAKALAKAGKTSSSLLYRPDLCMNPMRLVCALEILRRQNKKYARYCKKYR